MVKPSSSLRPCSSKKRKSKSKSKSETSEDEESSISLLRSCSSKKMKTKTEAETTEVEESSISLLRSCSSKKGKRKRKRKSKTKTKTETSESSVRLLRSRSNIDGEGDGDGDGGCKMIRDGCDFLCAEELGKQFLICGGSRYRSSNNNTKKVVSIRQVYKNTNVGILFADVTKNLYTTNKAGKLHFLSTLKEIYYKLKQQHGASAFEIVFVAYFRSREKEDINIFNSHLKQMPWLAVPFDDNKKWRKHILKRYNMECSGRNCNLLLFGPNGHLLEQPNLLDALEDLILFGPDLYPFTEAREKELIDKYVAPLRSPNKSKLLEALLGGGGGGGRRDFLISSGDGDEDYKRVPISQLERKVVGLYLLHQKHPNRDFMRKLEDFRLRAYSERGSSFEIVLINVDFESGYSSERSFRRFLKKWPWLLALPFKDDKIRGLYYVLSISCCVNALVIIDGDGGGGGEACDGFLIEPHGYYIIQEYGFDAYPFTRNMAIATAKKRLTQLTLADFFKATRTEFKPLSFLQNKRVLLYIANSSRRRDIRKLLDLQKKDNSLEVLVFGSQTSTPNALPEKWVAFPPAVQLWALIDKTVKVNMTWSNYFIAFDETGKLVKMGGMKLLKKDGGAAFPYITDETFDIEFRQMMIHKEEWNDEIEMEE